MRPTSNSILLTIAALLTLLFATACHTGKSVTGGDGDDSDFSPAAFLQQVAAQGVNQQYLTAKLKFSAEMGSQSASVGGSLKMKRDAVIRIQLTALGLMEVGRLEFTPDYVLIVDRVHKQYVKADYNRVDFLQTSGITFYTLQSLLWNELFQPGSREPDLRRFSATSDGHGGVAIALSDKGSMHYQWGAQRQTALITEATVAHRDATFRCDYADFKKLDKQLFPNDIQMGVSYGGKSLRLGFRLSSLGHDDDWELYTTVSKRYTEVAPEDILQKLISSGL